MRVRVRYFNVLADCAGTRQAEVQVAAETTIRGLLQHLIAANPEAFRQKVARGDLLSSYLRVFHNNRLVSGEGFEAPVAEGDEVMLFPAISGGRRT
jgi:MoaD family protein